jgi:hypothetical protein
MTGAAFMKFGRAPTTCATVSAMIPFPMGPAVDPCAVAVGPVSPKPGGPDAVH